MYEEDRARRGVPGPSCIIIMLVSPPSDEVLQSPAGGVGGRIRDECFFRYQGRRSNPISTYTLNKHRQKKNQTLQLKKPYRSVSVTQTKNSAPECFQEYSCLFSLNCSALSHFKSIRIPRMEEL